MKLVSEPGCLHIVAGPIGQTALTSREERQAFSFLQDHLQLLEVLKPRHILILRKQQMCVQKGYLIGQ